MCYKHQYKLEPRHNPFSRYYYFYCKWCGDQKMRYKKSFWGKVK